MVDKVLSFFIPADFYTILNIFTIYGYNELRGSRVCYKMNLMHRMMVVDTCHIQVAEPNKNDEIKRK